MTFEKIINEYNNYLLHVRKMTKQSLESYLQDIKQFLKYCQFEDNCNFEKLDHISINEYSKNLKQSLNTNSINRKLSSIKSFYNFLYQKKYTSSDLSIKIEKFKIVQSQHIYYSKEELFLFFDTLKYDTSIDFRNSLIVLLFYTTGIRLSELANLTLENVNLKQKVLLINGKGNKQRFVPLNDFIIKLLEKYIQQHYKMFNKQRHIDYLFMTYQGKQLNRTTISVLIKKLIINSGLNYELTAHSFRHLCATHLLENGVNLEDIQQFLGHEHLITTEIYLTLSPNYVREKYYLYHFIK